MVDVGNGIELIRLQPKHLRALAAYAAVARIVNEGDACRRLCKSTPAAAAVRNGQVLAAAGIVEIWSGRGMAWFLGGHIERRDWPVITAMVAAGIEQGRRNGYLRIECSVAEGHAAGHRWAQKLGFRPEAFCRHYLPQGRNAHLYVVLAE